MKQYVSEKPTLMPMTAINFKKTDYVIMTAKNVLSLNNTELIKVAAWSKA
jgi:hypothetical protein